MILKKSLRSSKAQMISEYILILLAIVGLIAAFLNGVTESMDTYQQGMVNRIANE